MASSKKAYGEMVRQVFKPKKTKAMEKNREEVEKRQEPSVAKSRLMKEYVDHIDNEGANNKYKDYLKEQRERRNGGPNDK